MVVYENNIEDIIEAQNGNQEKMTKLVEENNGLIWSIVKRFDTSFEVKLSTYAVPYILGEIKRFIRDDGSVKVSRSIKELAGKIKDIQSKYLKETGEEINITEIAKQLKMPKEEIAVALDSLKPTISIYDDSYTNDEGGISFLDTLSTNVDEAETLTNKLTIKEMITNLEQREKEIILLRYYKNKTQTEVAKILGISQVQVSRIEKKILNSMKLKLA